MQIFFFFFLGKVTTYRKNVKKRDKDYVLVGFKENWFDIFQVGDCLLIRKAADVNESYFHGRVTPCKGKLESFLLRKGRTYKRNHNCT